MCMLCILTTASRFIYSEYDPVQGCSVRIGKAFWVKSRSSSEYYLRWLFTLTKGTRSKPRMSSVRIPGQQLYRRGPPLCDIHSR